MLTIEIESTSGVFGLRPVAQFLRNVDFPIRMSWREGRVMQLELDEWLLEGLQNHLRRRGGDNVRLEVISEREVSDE